MPSNIYQAENGQYYARIQVNGRDIRRSLRTTDRKIARQRLKALIEKAADQRAGVKPPEVKTWEDAVVRWGELQFADLRPNTKKRYLVSLRQIDQHLAKRDIASITTQDVHEFSAARMKKGASAATIWRDLMVMGRAMRVAYRAGWIKQNPVPDEMSGIKERREPIRPVALRDLAHLLSVMNPRFRALIRFLARTGCRMEESASLEWSQVNLSSNATVTFSKTKTGAPRVIRISDRTAKELLRLKTAGATGPVFRNREGERFLSVTSRFRNYSEKAFPDKARRFRCHDLRHTYAIRALQHGTQIYDVSQHLGHTSVKTTEIYAAWLSKRLR